MEQAFQDFHEAVVTASTDPALVPPAPQPALTNTDEAFMDFADAVVDAHNLSAARPGTTDTPEGDIIPEMPTGFIPTQMLLVAKEGVIELSEVIEPTDTIEGVASKAHLLCQRVWVAMHETGYVQHDIVEDPTTHVRFCSKCHTPEHQALAGVSCTGTKIFDGQPETVEQAHG